MSEPIRRRRSPSFRRRWRKFKDWWRSTTEAKRELVRLGAGLALAGLAVGVFRLAEPVWRGLRQPSAPARAQAAARAEPDDYRHALQALQRATEADPNDPRVWREAMAVLSKIGSPEALVARRNLARLGPGELGLRIALVMEALRFPTSETGGGAAVPGAAAIDDPAFHRLAAAVALALGRTGDYEQHLAGLIAAEPGDAAARFNLAALRLWSADAAVSASAAAELAKLGEEPALRVRVALERLKFAASTHEPARVDAEVDSLRVLLGGRPPGGGGPGEPPGWSALVAGLKQAAMASPRDAALLARWLGGQGQGADALAWLGGLSDPLRLAAEVRAAATELAAGCDDLETLRGYLREGTWGRMPSETVDLLLAARVQRLRFGEKRARATWDDAVATSLDSLAGLHSLARLGVIWKDRDGTDRALQAIVDRHPLEDWACEALRVSYSEQRDMDKLWRLYQTWAPRVPDDKPVQQAWILLGALLNRGEAGQLARAEALLTAEGDQPEETTLLAVAAARWRAGLPEEAEAALARLSPMARAEPRVQVWAAVFAADRDDLEALDEILAKMPRGDLLREEQILLGNALAASERRRRVADRGVSAWPGEEGGPAPAAEVSPMTETESGPAAAADGEPAASEEGGAGQTGTSAPAEAAPAQPAPVVIFP